MLLTNLEKYRSAKEIFQNADVKKILTLTSKYSFSNLNNLSIKELKKLAKFIFTTNHSQNVFQNIIVNKSGIDECIEKIYNNKIQRDLLKQHFIIFENLGTIINNAELVSQHTELKKRKNIKYWNYYLAKVKINKIIYKVLIDVRVMKNYKMQYYLHRIEITEK